MDSNALLAALLAVGFALQPPGAFHGNEPVARDGERWLALRVDGDEAALVATTLQVRAVHDEVLDEPGERTGLEVTSALGDAGVAAYLRGSRLRAGRIALAAITSPADALLLDARHEIQFRSRRYRLDTRCDETRVERIEGQPQWPCRFVLDDGHNVQTLHALTAYAGWIDGRSVPTSEAWARIVFAGDLDRDGRLDLVLETDGGDYGSRTVLWLSSQAPDGGLVGEAAVYEVTGC